MEQNKGEIYRLIPQVMREIGAVGKDRANQQQGYKFRGIDDFYNAVHGPLATAGVFVVPTVVDLKREERERAGRDGRPGGVMFYVTLTVRHTFYAPDGSSIDAVTVGEAMDTGDKASNKAMSAAMKYALIEVFAIPTEEDNDTENDSPEVKAKGQPNGRKSQAPAPDNSPQKATPEQVKELREMVAAGTIPQPTVKKWFAVAKINEFSEMSTDQAEKCIRYGKSKQAPAAEPQAA